MSLVWTIIVLGLLYGAVGIGAEFINTQDHEPFAFDKITLMRILSWPKRLFAPPAKKE